MSLETNYEYCSVGGLGDVAGALPKALARRGHRVMVTSYKKMPLLNLIPSL